MRKILFLAFLLSFGFNCQAQKHHSGSIIRIGVGPNYYFGDRHNEIAWKPDNIGYQLDVMAGYRFSERNSNPLVVGAFGRMGIISDQVVARLLNEGGVSAKSDNTKQNEFYEAEVGLILFKFLRFSTGMGFQHYRTPKGSLKNLLYRNSTAGIQIHTRSIKWEVNATALHDKELSGDILRFSAVLAFEF